MSDQTFDLNDAKRPGRYLVLLFGLSLLFGCDRGGGENAFRETSPSRTATTTTLSPRLQRRSREARSVVRNKLKVAPEGSRAGYDRDLFDHWIDADADGCDTRDEVLIAESVVAVATGPDCSLSGGRWHSAFDGVMTSEASVLDVDHLVPLAEAWDSGASAWDPARRRAFANDLGYAGSLIAVTAEANRSKGDQDPAEWKPPKRTYWCAYARTWRRVKLRWRLSANPGRFQPCARCFRRARAERGVGSGNELPDGERKGVHPQAEQRLVEQLATGNWQLAYRASPSLRPASSYGASVTGASA